jgi:putative membrane protein
MLGNFYGYGTMGRVGFRGCGFLGTDWWSRGLMIGLILIGITIIVLLAINLAKRSHEGSSNHEALTILKKRYANGEIDEALFEKMKRELR